MHLYCPDFDHGECIPVKHTCDGANVSPRLQWTAVPSGTKSFALICDDPDAPMGTQVHWLLYDVPATRRELPEHLSASGMLSGRVKQGITDFGCSGYRGPCPSRGKLHRYIFKLFALDTQLALKPGATKAELLNAMKDHDLGDASLMGVYERC
jgi:Raf kinase inhibitor-like YbhB/YbcL family protein